MLLGLIALLIGWKALCAAHDPQAINFAQAIFVAVVGLAVNLASAWLFARRSRAWHDMGMGTGTTIRTHTHMVIRTITTTTATRMTTTTTITRMTTPARRRQQPTPRAAYFHVLAGCADLGVGDYGAVDGQRLRLGVAGPGHGHRRRADHRALVHRADARRRRGASGPPARGHALLDEIRAAIETGGDRISDPHVAVGPGHFGAIVAIRSAAPQPLAVYRARLSHLKALSHLTVEIEPEG